MNTQLKKIAYSAILIAIGVVLPQAFHLTGAQQAGQIFLPMHIPVLLAGITVGPFYGAIVAIIAPIISSLITGMPAVPYVFFMMIELIAYAVSAGIIKKYLNIYFSLIGGMIIGRCLYAITLLILGQLLGIDAAPKVFSVLAAISVGIPGIIIQLIFIPPIYIALKKSGLLFDKKDNVISKLKRSKANCYIITQSNKEISSNESGIKPIINVIDSDKSVLNSAFVADRVIGKAAAMLLIDGQVSYIYGDVMSEMADKILSERNIKHSYKTLVPYIINRAGDGMCPMEEAVLDIENPADAYNSITKKINELKNKK